MVEKEYTVIWTQTGFEDFKAHFYILGEGSKVAAKFKQEIKEITTTLESFPRAFQIEERLTQLDLEIRRAVVINRFKLLYEVDNKTVTVFMIFDTRKAPHKLSQRFWSEYQSE